MSTDKYIMIKTAKNAYFESLNFFKEIAKAIKNNEFSIVYENNKPVGINYTDKNGVKKIVKRREILSNAKRMKSSLLILKPFLKKP